MARREGGRLDHESDEIGVLWVTHTRTAKWDHERTTWQIMEDGAVILL